MSVYLDSGLRFFDEGVMHAVYNWFRAGNDMGIMTWCNIGTMLTVPKTRKTVMHKPVTCLGCIAELP